MNFLLTQNNLLSIKSTQESSGGCGRVIYWSSQARGISFSLQNNNFSNINCEEGKGAIVYASYTFNSTSVLTNGELSPEYLVTINSEDNLYEYVSAQSGGIISSQDDTQLLRITLQNDSLNFVSATQNRGAFDIQYASSSSNDTSSPSRLLSSNIGGTIIIISSNFSNLSASNDGLIYEMSPPNSVLLNFTNNTFSSIVASRRGGVFYLYQPNLLVSQNNFSFVSAGLTGNLLYSVSDQADT